MATRPMSVIMLSSIAQAGSDAEARALKLGAVTALIAGYPAACPPTVIVIDAEALAGWLLEVTAKA